MSIDMAALGWRKEEMGGYLLAWRKDVDGGYIIVSDLDNSLESSQDAHVWSAGRYLDNGEAYGWIVSDGHTLADAINVANGMDLPEHGDEISV